jgi:hypothetical protein
MKLQGKLSQHKTNHILGSLFGFLFRELSKRSEIESKVHSSQMALNSCGGSHCSNSLKWTWLFSTRIKLPELI